MLIKRGLSNSRAFLIAILVIAAVLRFIGTNPGYNQFHSDEPIIYGSAVDMIRNGNLDPGRFDYPSVSLYINYLFYKFLFIPIGWFMYYAHHISEIVDGTIHIPASSLESKRVLQLFIFGNREINVLFWGRYIAALFSLGNALLVYLVTKKLFGRRAAVLAAFLLAFNFRHVLNSHVNLPDIYNSFFLLAAVLQAIRTWEKPAKINYLLAGITSGLSFSTKYQVFALFPVLTVLSFDFFERKKLDIKLGLVVILGFILTFLLTNPYFFPHLEIAISWIIDVSKKYGMGTNKLNLFPLSYLYHHDLGPIEFFLIPLGFLVALKRDWKKFLLLLSVIIPFFFVFLYYSSGGFYVRNLITITPFLLIFVAPFLERILSVNKFIFAVALAASIFIPARNSIINTFYNTKPWNYQIMSDWLYKNPIKEKIASHPFDPPTGAPPLDKTEFELSGAYDMAEHMGNGAKYALINMDWAGNPFYSWMGFGLKDVHLWNKPTKNLRDSFYGLAIEEMLKYQIFSATKPWQAPDANLVLVKFPDWGDVKFNSLMSRNGEVLSLVPKGDKFGNEKTSLTQIQIKGGYLYKIAGVLSSSRKFSERDRDGFLRVDFDKAGASSLSARILQGKSKMVEIVARAPDEAKFMTITLQAYTAGIPFTLSGLKIDESSEEVNDLTLKAPYTREEIDLNLLYPNSHGNL